MGLTDRLLKGVKKRGIGDTLKNSEFGQIDYYLPLETISMNLLTSGKWDGGVPNGKLTMFAGGKGSTKTLNMYSAIKSMQNQFKDHTIIYIDAEHAVEKDQLIKDGIDISNLIYFPLSRIDDENKEESLMYQISNIVKEVEVNEKVIICLDSMGVLTTGRTNANALKGNVAKDMSINSDKKKFMNLLLEVSGIKKIPVLVINHIYDAVGGFGDPTVVAGGSVLYIPSTVVLITSKAKMKADSDGYCTDEQSRQTGNIFTATVYKGRLSKEKSIAKFGIHYKYGFLKYSGLAEHAVEGGFIEATKDGRSTVYKIVDGDATVAKKTMYLPENYPFWETLFKTTKFGEYLNSKYSYGILKESE